MTSRPWTNRAAAMVVTWALNRTLTFASETPPNWREFGHYAAVAIYWIALALGAPTWAAFILGVGLTAVFSFWRYRRLLGKR
jgi:putative flippase GtrA